MKFHAEGAKLFALQMGAGPDVVLLQPTPVDHTFWMPAARSLESGYRVLIPDLRGHGVSELGDGPLSIELMARDIVAMMQAAGVDRAVFAGCSIGCYVLYELWRQIPERILGLAFCCGKPHGDSPSMAAQRAETIEEVRVRGTHAFFERMLATLVGAPAARSRPAIVDELRAMMQRMQPDAVAATQRALGLRQDSMRTAATIRVPDGWYWPVSWMCLPRQAKCSSWRRWCPLRSFTCYRAWVITHRMSSLNV